jgi:hypothetical protein
VRVPSGLAGAYYDGKHDEIAFNQFNLLAFKQYLSSLLKSLLANDSPVRSAREYRCAVDTGLNEFNTELFRLFSNYLMKSGSFLDCD